MSGQPLQLKAFSKRIRFTLFFIILTFSIWTSISKVYANDLFPVFILLSSQTSPSDQLHLQATIQNHGGRITHTFPQQALIANVPADAIPSLSELPAVLALFTQPVELATIDIYGPQARSLASIWNSLLQPQTHVEKDSLSAQHSDPENDAFIAPDLPQGDELSSAAGSVTPGYYQTSEYMAGSVAVGIVLLESDGSNDPSTENWTGDEKQLVLNEIVNAFNWWVEMEPRATLSFVYEDHFTNPLPTSLEPVTRPYYHESYWISDAMNALGFTSANHFTQVRDYNNYLRNTYQTDWAFTIFVVDSANDSDNKFSDGHFAYAYLGGPFMVMTSGNNGYGPNNMDAVAAHEMGHIFNALDQYYNAHQSCTRRSGYLYVENQNSQYGGCGSNATSIMRGQIYPYAAKAIDSYAAGQIGWRDSDGDGILDPLDTDLPVSIDSFWQDGNSVTIGGTTQIIPFPAPVETDITINSLTGVQYRVDGGSWQPATATGGEFGGTEAGYQMEISGLPAGQHTIEVATTDSAGNISDEYASQQVIVSDPVDGGLNTELYPLAGQSGDGQAATVEGTAYHLTGGTVVSVEYRVDGGAWQTATAQDGTFDSSNETFAITLNAQPGEITTVLVEARAIDNLGHTEVNFASQSVQIGSAKQYSTFLPLIIR